MNSFWLTILGPHFLAYRVEVVELVELIELVDLDELNQLNHLNHLNHLNQAISFSRAFASPGAFASTPPPPPYRPLAGWAG